MTNWQWDLIEAVREAMQARSHRQYQAAQKMDVPPPQLSEWLSYKRCPNRANEKKLRDYINGGSK